MTFLIDDLSDISWYGAMHALGTSFRKTYPDETQIYQQLLELASFIEGREIRDVSFAWGVE